MESGAESFGKVMEGLCCPSRLVRFTAESVESVNNWHFPMIHDRERGLAYLRALKRADVFGRIVLDLGAGSGLLSVLAAKLGARRVVALEASSDLCGVCRKVVRANGVSETVEVIHALSTRFRIENEVDFETLLVFTESDLAELGIAKGPRVKMLRTMHDWHKRDTAPDLGSDSCSSRPSRMLRLEAAASAPEDEFFNLPEPVRATCATPTRVERKLTRPALRRPLRLLRRPEGCLLQWGAGPLACAQRAAGLQLSCCAPGSSPAQLTAVQVGRASARPALPKVRPRRTPAGPTRMRRGAHAHIHPARPTAPWGRFAPLSHNSQHPCARSMGAAILLSTCRPCAGRVRRGRSDRSDEGQMGRSAMWRAG